MKNPVNSFISGAKYYTRNPLGVIALFIVLVYAIAALVFGISGDAFNYTQKWFLLLFVIFYPILVLFIFYNLVTKHHTKLYGPMDFPNQGDFLKAASINLQNKKITEEVAEESSARKETEIVVDSEDKTDKTKKEFSKSDIRSRFILAEELALRDLESVSGSSVRRQVVIGNTNIVTDGMIFSEGITKFIEVKYTRRRYWKDIVLRALTQLDRAASHFKGPITYIIIVVCEGLSFEEREGEVENAKKILDGSNNPAVLFAYDIEELERKFGLI